MKAFIIYLKEIQSTVDSALECKHTARQHGLDAWMLEGFTPSRADEFIKENIYQDLNCLKLNGKKVAFVVA